MKTMGIAALVVLSAVAAAGCDSEEDIDGLDFGTVTGDMSVKVYSLVSGTYKVTALRDKMDGCMIDTANMLVGATFTLTNDNNANVTLGNAVAAQPGEFTQGKGQVLYNTGTLSRPSYADMLTATCTLTFDRKNVITVTADNKFTSKFTENQTVETPGCGTTTHAPCASTWTWDLEKQ